MRFRVHRGRRHGFPEGLMAMASAGWGSKWGGWDFDWGAPPGRGRRGRRRMFEAGELRLVLLKLLSDEPHHGYDLIRAIEELTHGAYAPSPGVVYPTLTMLEDMGLIEEGKADGARKIYEVTDAGKAHLEEHASEVERLMDRLEDVGSDRRRAGSAPIKRSVANLLSALWHRVSSEGMDEDMMHEIAEILDEAAQRIERLK